MCVCVCASMFLCMHIRVYVCLCKYLCKCAVCVCVCVLGECSCVCQRGVLVCVRECSCVCLWLIFHPSPWPSVHFCDGVRQDARGQRFPGHFLSSSHWSKGSGFPIHYSQPWKNTPTWPQVSGLTTGRPRADQQSSGGREGTHLDVIWG